MNLNENRIMSLAILDNTMQVIVFETQQYSPYHTCHVPIVCAPIKLRTYLRTLVA